MLKTESIPQVIEIYKQLIAEVTILRDAIESCHLNVRGLNFYQYHLLFERIGDDLDSAITVDELGERIGSIDNSAIIPVSTALAVKSSQILQTYGDVPVSKEGNVLTTYLVNCVTYLANLLCQASDYLVSIGADSDANKVQEYEYKVRHLLYLLLSQLTR